MAFAVIDIDSIGTFRMCHKALKYLKKGGPGKDPSTGGTIINISAVIHYGASWYQIHASAAKVSKFVGKFVKSLLLILLNGIQFPHALFPPGSC